MRLMSKIFNLNDPGWGRGNNNGSEPPRRPNQGEGPPDLDEVWRDFNNRLGSLFGRKPKRGGQFGGGNGNGSGSRPQLPKGSPKSIAVIVAIIVALRSEEHTSELQSPMRTSYAVFCLKKTNHATNNYHLQLYHD